MHRKFRFKIVQGGDHDLIQSQKGDEVRNHHQAVKEVGKRPDEIDLQRCTQHDEAADDETVNVHAAALKEETHVLFTEEVPADDGGERKEEEADCNKRHAETAEGGGVGVLRQFNAGRLIVEHPGYQNHDPGEGHDHDRCKDAENGDEPLFGRMFHLSDGMRVRR